MSVRQIFEVVQDGPSVIVWEGVHGTRISLFTERQAQGLADELSRRANQFHRAKEQNDGSQDDLLITITVYSKEYPDGEDVTEFAFIRRFLDRIKRIYETERVERPPAECW